jgi:hypothetical protein
MNLENRLTKQLSDAGNVAGLDGSIGSQGPVHVHLGVDVDSALDIETREDGLHLHHALRIGGPHATKPSGVVSVQICYTNLEAGDILALQ